MSKSNYNIIKNILDELDEELKLAKKMKQECANNRYWDGYVNNQASIRGLRSAIEIIKKHSTPE
jgi:hypothetical protein